MLLLCLVARQSILFTFALMPFSDTNHFSSWSNFLFLSISLRFLLSLVSCFPRLYLRWPPSSELKISPAVDGILEELGRWIIWEHRWYSAWLSQRCRKDLAYTILSYYCGLSVRPQTENATKIKKRKVESSRRDSTVASVQFKLLKFFPFELLLFPQHICMIPFILNFFDCLKSIRVWILLYI